MLNRLRRWFYRRIEGAPITPLSVQVSEPWADPWIQSHIEKLRGGFGHDAVQLQADEWPDEYTPTSLHYMLTWPNPVLPPVTYTDEGWKQRTADYDPDYDYHLGSDY